VAEDVHGQGSDDVGMSSAVLHSGEVYVIVWNFDRLEVDWPNAYYRILEAELQESSTSVRYVWVALEVFLE
jgi:hypothetical protein